MSYAKAKGTSYETAIVKYFTECGFTTARRIALSGAAGDKGDIWLGDNPVVPDLVLECKNYAKDIAYKQIEDFVQEAHTEYKNATKLIVNPYRALLCVKRTNLGVADSWLIWKNDSGITLRCRLGDAINKDTFTSCNTETERISLLEKLLSNKV